MKTYGRKILLLCLVGIVAMILYQICMSQQQIPDDLNHPALATNDDREEEFIPDWHGLLSENKDTVGYLIIEGTGINTPIVQGIDNEHYLYHNFRGKDDNKGTLFLDSNYRFFEPKSTNAVIYGHSNMRSGEFVPFDDLHDYESHNFYLDHQLIRYDRLPEAGGKGVWKIVAVIKVDKYFDYRRSDFRDQEDFEDYYHAIIDESIYETGEMVRYGDEILTLSTCARPSPDGRLAVVAKRI